MGATRRSVDQLVRGKWSSDEWPDLAHLTDAELVEYLFRVGNAFYHQITLAIPDVRLAALAPNLNSLLAASPKCTWLHRRFNHTDAERANLIRAAVVAARAQVQAETALRSERAAAGPSGSSVPFIASSVKSPTDELVELAAERRLLQCERDLLRHEIDMLKKLREENGRERLRAEREFQRRVVAGVLATLFAATAVLLIGARVK